MWRCARFVRSRLEGMAVTTAEELATDLGVDEGDVDAALVALEGEGFVLRGRFRPGAGGTEWCERRLLARIHRYTLGRLRREIEPVSAAVYMRFLARWQHTEGDARVEGPEGLAAVLAQLEGFETAAAAWESDVLPVRTKDYDPAWLDALCLSGRVTWARRTPGAARTGRAGGPVRSTPIAIADRAALPRWLAIAATAHEALDASLSADGRAVVAVLDARGASFFDDVVRATGLLRTRVEEALGELVSLGLVTSDGFSGLRALLVPASRRLSMHGGRRRGRKAAIGMESAGRWTRLLRVTEGDSDIDAIARTLLLRWGVVFRKLAEREGALPPWRDLLRVWRRLEARGEIRGGRFVDGFTGEQFALPEAIGLLRTTRRTDPDGALLSVSGVDPLNLVGIVTPGKRVAALAKNRVLWRDGVPVAVREGRDVRILGETGDASRWQLEGALTRRRLPAGVQAYLGHGA